MQAITDLRALLSSDDNRAHDLLDKIGEAEAEQLETITKHGVLLRLLDICPKCLQAWEITDPSEPFATCGCPGASEWTGTAPVLSTLRHKAAKADRELTATDNLTISRSDADRINEIIGQIEDKAVMGVDMEIAMETLIEDLRKLIPNPDA